MLSLISSVFLQAMKVLSKKKLTRQAGFPRECDRPGDRQSPPGGVPYQEPPDSAGLPDFLCICFKMFVEVI